ncbi:hypothetical protein Taro_014576, partial [Colocasia esculenta]|nr:hypothetical protein [Colocasia esculenta]
MIIYLTNDLCVIFSGTNIFLQSSVDTTIYGVDTMAQSKDRNVKKRSTSVDTRPGSTLDGFPRRPVLLSGIAGRHEIISGRH